MKDIKKQFEDSFKGYHKDAPSHLRKESAKHKALAKLALRNMRRITGDKNYKTPSSPYKKFNDK